MMNRSPANEDVSTPTCSTTTNSIDHQKLARLADFYGDDPDYNPYEDLSNGGANATTTGTVSRPANGNAPAAKNTAVTAIVVGGASNDNSPPEDSNASAAPATSPQRNNTTNAFSTAGTAMSVGERHLTDSPTQLPFLPRQNTLESPPRSPQVHHGSGHPNNNNSTMATYNVNNTSFNDDAASSHHRMGGAQSVSAADGSVANSADLGRMSDLDVFTHHRHNPYLGAVLEGGYDHHNHYHFGGAGGGEDGGDHQQQHLQNDGGNNNNRRHVPSFEQTDRYVAEFYQYQQQQEDALAYYNDRRRDSGGAGHYNNAEHDNGGGEHYGQQYGGSACAAAAQPSAPTNHPSAGNPNSGTQQANEPRSAFPFASDMMPLLPEELACDPTVKKQKMMGAFSQFNNKVGGTPSANNNDAARNEAPAGNEAAAEGPSDETKGKKKANLTPVAVTAPRKFKYPTPPTGYAG